MINRENIVFFAAVFTLCNAYTKQDLGGQWAVTGGGDTPFATDNATVPGGIFSDLMNNNIIGDIFAGKGDSDYSWVGESDWTYSRSFTVNEDLMSYATIQLIFEGLDTFATILINGIEVGSSKNMFVRYTFSIKEQLQVGENEIEVQFSSPVNVAKALAEDPSNKYIIPPECPAPQYRGICHPNRIRKMQSSFSWDWGPAFASVGIWKEVYLQAFHDAVIDYLVVSTNLEEERDLWFLYITTYVMSEGIHIVTGTFTYDLETNNGTISFERKLEKPFARDLSITYTTFITVSTEEVNSWWPNGYGSQDLYNLTVSFIAVDETFQKTVRVGFQDIVLVQDNLEKGRNFYFEVNGQPIFAKGANEIPINILPERGQDPATVRKLLQAVKDTNMNMLRVWGGGVYESDLFYDLADEFGILIWQDFMFASAMYPADLDFLENVSEEIQHQLKRLASHPSIAVWSGNNENEGNLRSGRYGTQEDYNSYYSDYIKLYIDTIKTQVAKIAFFDHFVPSSPTNGIESELEGFVASNPGDSYYGDVHYYNYVSDSWNVSNFPIPRFSSEYGYQSYPSVESWLTATDQLDDLNPLSDFMDYRQHHPDGNMQNLDLIGLQLQLPDNMSVNYTDAVIYFSQIVQAQSIKMETEHYRSFKGRLDDNQQGNTMGALYWQLNDVWVSPTWSGIDFTGRWKMLQYFTQDFFSPLIITGRLISTNDLEIYAILDALQVPNINIKALVRVYAWNRMTPLISVEFQVSLDPLKSVLVTTLDAPSALTIAGCGTLYEVARAKCFFDLRLIDQANNDVAPANYVFPGKLKDSDLYNATVQISSVTPSNDENTEFAIEINTNGIALFVWMDSHEVRGRFSENGFLQMVDSKTVYFIAEEAVDVDDLVRILTVTHLRDPAYF